MITDEIGWKHATKVCMVHEISYLILFAMYISLIWITRSWEKLAKNIGFVFYLSHHGFMKNIISKLRVVFVWSCYNDDFAENNKRRKSGLCLV